MKRRLHPWWLALGVSLLLHGALLGSPGWRLPRWQTPSEPPPLEARLAPLPKAPAPAPPRRPAPPAAKVLPAPRPPSPPAAPAAAEQVVEPVVVAAAPAASADVQQVVEPVAMPVAPAPVEPGPPPLNTLPDRLELRYKLRYGIATGEQVLLWVNEGERYTLTSVAEATGLAGLFLRGKLVQISRGRITPRGLQPEEFWDQRGDKHSSGRFDAENRMLTLEPDNGPPRHFSYTGEVQDVLSLFFQFALTAPPPTRQQTWTVFNGKKLRQYTYEIRGQAPLETALGTVNALHLARLTDGDGRFEIWLDVDRHYLPVRILRSEESKADVELAISSIAGG